MRLCLTARPFQWPQLPYDPQLASLLTHRPTALCSAGAPALTLCCGHFDFHTHTRACTLIKLLKPFFERTCVCVCVNRVWPVCDWQLNVGTSVKLFCEEKESVTHTQTRTYTTQLAVFLCTRAHRELWQGKTRTSAFLHPQVNSE